MLIMTHISKPLLFSAGYCMYVFNSMFLIVCFYGSNDSKKSYDKRSNSWL